MDTGKTVTVLGREYPVQLDTESTETYYTGMKFYVNLGGANELRAPSFRELAHLASEYKDTRFDLPFTTSHGVNGSVTGFHAGNGNLLVRWENGATSQESDYRLARSMPQLSKEDHAELARLIDAHKAAKDAWDAFVNERAFPAGVLDAANDARAEKAGISA